MIICKQINFSRHLISVRKSPNEKTKDPSILVKVEIVQISSKDVNLMGITESTAVLTIERKLKNDVQPKNSSTSYGAQT